MTAEQQPAFSVELLRQAQQQQAPDNTQAALAKLLAQHTGNAYDQLNAVRDWVNTHLPGLELYLEDVWNEHVPGQTWFEYILRSKITRHETAALAYDVYANHQDTGGVWHLDDYSHTVRLLDDAALIELIVGFSQSHGQ